MVEDAVRDEGNLRKVVGDDLSASQEDGDLHMIGWSVWVRTTLLYPRQVSSRLDRCFHQILLDVLGAMLQARSV
jgi:hypothetical protein